jgi:hypothetical protein
VPTHAWIAFGCTVLLLIFAFLAYFFPPKGDNSQLPILRVLLSLLAGFGAWFIAGIALFSLNVNLVEGEQMAVSGTLGFALFFAVFYGMRQPAPPKPEASVTVDVASGWTFGDTARKIAGADKNVRLEGFTQEQLDAALLPGKLGPLPTIEVLRHLGRMVESPGFPEYDVSYNAPIYVIRKKV